MSICPHCGSPVAGKLQNCPCCGARLSAAPEEVTRLDVDSVVAEEKVTLAVDRPQRASGRTRRVCPACGKAYEADYRDTFCVCGTELSIQEYVIKAAVTPERSPLLQPSALPAQPTARSAPERPPPGTRCLVLYGPGREALRYFPLEKDVVQIGRQDSVAGCFPEIDVSAWLDEAGARRVSRQHALILHSRRDDSYYLRPLSGNTGTQIDADMVPALNDYLLLPGTRVLLGGAIRFKFEIIQE